MPRAMTSASLLAATLALALGAAAPAQTLSAHFAQNPVALGQPITITYTDTTGNGFVVNGSSCYGRTIHASKPNGATVYMPMICTADLGFIAPYGSFTAGWNQQANGGGQVPPGTYYFLASANGVTNYFPITILAANTDPKLTEVTGAQVNQPLTLALQAPLLPFAPFATAFSLTTNTGLQLGSTFISLDPDFLFSLSLPPALPGLFNGTAGSTDVAGAAAGITLNIPNVPGLAHLGLAAQAVLIDQTTAQLVLTNTLSFTIAP